MGCLASRFYHTLVTIHKVLDTVLLLSSTSSDCIPDIHSEFDRLIGHVTHFRRKSMILSGQIYKVYNSTYHAKWRLGFGWGGWGGWGSTIDQSLKVLEAIRETHDPNLMLIAQGRAQTHDSAPETKRALWCGTSSPQSGAWSTQVTRVGCVRGLEVLSPLLSPISNSLMKIHHCCHFDRTLAAVLTHTFRGGGRKSFAEGCTRTVLVVRLWGSNLLQSAFSLTTAGLESSLIKNGLQKLNLTYK